MLSTHTRVGHIRTVAASQKKVGNLTLETPIFFDFSLSAWPSNVQAVLEAELILSALSTPCMIPS